MNWEIKRYGGKIYPGGSGYTKFAEIRFFIAIFVFFAMIFSKIMANEWYGLVYILVWFVYTFVAFIPEILRKLNECLIIVFSLGCTFYINLSNEQPFFSKYSKINFQESGGSEWVLLSDGVAIQIFTCFNILVVFISLVFMFLRIRGGKKGN